MPRAFLVPGVVAGLLLGLAFILLARAPLNYGIQEVLGLAAAAVAAGGAQFIAMRAAREHTQFPGAFAPYYFLAMLTGAVTAFVYGLVAWLHYTVIDREYLERFYLEYVERARAAASSPEEAQQLLAAAGRMKDFITDPFSQAMVQFGTVLMVSLLTGLLVTVLSKRVAQAG